MAENKPNARAQKTLQSSKELAKSTRDIVAKEKDKILEIIKNNIVDRRIAEKEAKLKALTEIYDENEVDAINALKLEEDLERKKLSEDYEAIVKKQLQILEADERGKLALLNEISEIKQRQKKRSEALEARKKALLVEKERARRVAALPPPLPRSVKLLLKEQEKKDSEAPPISNSCSHQELYSVEEEFEDLEDKENMDEEYHERRRQMQGEWDRKAKKRYNEAIKKDRQKQEHAQILKEIDNAEKISRRQMAKNLSEPCGKVPCALSDRLNHIEKQGVLEDAVERVYKKSNTTKEHVIEDLEGYEDKWESKYKQIDSNLEEKLINCVPSFVKQNYSYLLEEEPARQCRNRFSNLNDSDELNTAYIESPTEQINSSDRISAVISHLDQMISESNEFYEKEFKPLLEAENLKGDLPKTSFMNKSVEVNILRLPTEDKSTYASENMPGRRNGVPSTSRSTQADFMNSGVMAFKRRGLGKNKSYLGNLSDPQSQQQSWEEPETAHTNGSSWSSSSYLSLPSRHGQPDICKLCDSPSCRLPLVDHSSEDKDLLRDCFLRRPLVDHSSEAKDLHRDYIPLAKSHRHSQDDKSGAEDKGLHRDYIPLANSHAHLQEDTSSAEDKALHRDSLSKSHGYSREDFPDEESSEEKSRILSYIQLVADKYLKKTPVEGGLQERAGEDEAHLGTSKRVISVDLSESGESDSKAATPTSAAAIKQPTSEKKSRTQKMELPQIPPYKKSETGNKPEKEEFVKRCHEILNEKLSDIFSTEDGAESEVFTALKSAISEEASADRRRKLTPGELVYHELSTILEMDSALTNDPSLQDSSKRTNVSGSSSASSLSRKSGDFISPDEVDTRSVSLVDVPISEASELAKSIRFIAELSEKPPDSVAQLFEAKTPLGVISGTLSDFQTPSPRTVSEAHKSATRMITESPKKPSESISKVFEPKTPLGLISGTLSEFETPSPHVASEAKESATRNRMITESSGKPSKSASQVLEPKTPLALISGMLSNIQSPSPSPASEAHRPKPALTKSLATPTQMSSTEIHSNFSTPSTLQSKNIYYSSRDLLTPTSQLSTHSKESEVPNPIPYSSSFRFANLKQQFLTSLTGDLPEYFRDISSIKQDSSTSQGENGSTQKVKPADGRQTVPKTFHPRVPVQQIFFPKDFDGNFGTDERSTMSFMPLTPHSNVSSPGTMHTEHDNKTIASKEGNDQQKRPYLPKSTSDPPHSLGSSEGSFKPLTTRSNISTPTDFPGSRERPNADFTETGNSDEFRPLTTHSNISTPDYFYHRPEHLDSEGNNNRQEKYSASQKERRDWVTAENSTTSFQPLTPQSYMSTPNLPSQRHDLVPEQTGSRHGTRPTLQKEEDYLYSAENSECVFQPLTPQSYMSTPNLPSQARQYFDTDENGTSNGFQRLTSHSNISSPTSNTNISSKEDLRLGSTSSTNLKLRIPRHLISSATSGLDAEAVSDGQNENASGASSGTSLRFKLRVNIKDQNYMNPGADPEDVMGEDGVHLQEELSAYGFKSSKKGLNNEHDLRDAAKLKKVPSSDMFVPQLSAAEDAQKLKKPAKVCSSDFFVTQLPSSEFPGLQKRYFSTELSDCPETPSAGSSNLPTCASSLASISSMTSSGGKSTANSNERLRHVTGLLNDEFKSLTPSGSGTPCFSAVSQLCMSPNPILAALRKKFASDPSLKTLSSCSSQETLSDISASKVTFQSTPIKTIEEIIQETGILDEPDLTLMTTELTMRPESPDKTRYPAENSITRTEISTIPTATPSNADATEGLAKTPTAGATTSYAESPSMMSFLQHENSCFGNSKTEENSHLTPNNSNEELVYEDEFGHQFGKNQPKYEYKKRTKRLWNNLEEVKTKKMEEERKKKSAENRLKMKAYSKVYNPSKKMSDP